MKKSNDVSNDMDTVIKETQKEIRRAFHKLKKKKGARFKTTGT